MYNHEQYIGKLFGSLEVVGIGQTNKHRKKCLIVKCNIHPWIEPYEVVKQSLINGSTKGCVECQKEKHQTHGLSKTRTYNIYKRIIQRCLNKNDKDYSNYGERGIDLDPRYDPKFENQGLECSFMNFYNDIGDIQDPLTCDRIDNNKGYWKDNIQLVSQTDQARNKRNNIMSLKLANKIREEYQTGNYTYKDLQEKYNISKNETWRILSNRLWKN